MQILRRILDTVTDRLRPVVDLYRPYVDGMEHLPFDGRFLLARNHTQYGIETFLISDTVRRAIGTRVRPLADRGLLRGRRVTDSTPLFDAVATQDTVISGAGSPR